MQLLQMMMDTGQFAEFISGMQVAKNEEKEWEFYLYRVRENICFDEFKERLMQSVAVVTSTSDLEATVKHSFNMMESFHL